MSETHDYDGIKESGKPAPIYFNVLFYGLIIWGLLYSAYFLFSGWSSGQEFQDKMEAHQMKYNIIQVK